MSYLTVVVKPVAVSGATFFDLRAVDLLQSLHLLEVTVMAGAAHFMVIIGATVRHI